MHRLSYVASGGEEVELDAPGAWSGTALGLRGRAWSYELSWRGASGISRDAREAEWDVSFTDPAAADRLRRLADRDLSLGRPGRLVFDGEWSQRAYIAKSEPTEAYSSRGLRATLTALLLDGAWRREVDTDFFSARDEAGAGDWLDYPRDYPYDYGGSGVNRTVTVEGLVPAALRLEIYGPATNPRVTVTQGTWANVYAVDAEVPGGSRLVVDGSAFPKTIKLVGTYGEETDLFPKGVRGEGAGSGSYCFEPLPAGTSSVAWDGSFGFLMRHYEEEGEPPWSS